MTMTPGWRKLALTAHVTCSVGWLGAVAAFLALAIVGLKSDDPGQVRAAYVAMDMTGWFVIVPLSVAALVSGLVQSFGTDWGVFRHYWVVAKLGINVLASIILLLHMRPISYVAGIAAETTLSPVDLRRLRIQILGDAGAALVALLVATTLSIYKPRGLTAYGRRQLAGTTRGLRSTPARSWGVYMLYASVAAALLFVLLHLAGGGMRH